MSNWLIYGANGYTGELIAREAKSRGMTPILAGRSGEKIEPLAAELELPARVFSLEAADSVAEALAGCEFVLHCAGPFVDTSQPMIDGCLAAGAHYLDITGEIDAIEAAAARHDEAVERGVTILPAVGFDVVPTDCLAAMLAEKLPGATQLELAFTMLLKTSPGTTKTIARTLPKGGRVRRGGKIERVPVAWKTRTIPFATGEQLAMTIPWGDVATAFYSTGIENITVFTGMPKAQIRGLRWLRWMLPVMKWPWVRGLIDRTITKRVRGPSASHRRKNTASLWGEVCDGDGRCVSATMETPEGYALTVLSALAVVERLLDNPPPPGFTTPSQAFGADFVLQLPGVTMNFVDGESADGDPLR